MGTGNTHCIRYFDQMVRKCPKYRTAVSPSRNKHVRMAGQVDFFVSPIILSSTSDSRFLPSVVRNPGYPMWLDLPTHRQFVGADSTGGCNSKRPEYTTIWKLPPVTEPGRTSNQTPCCIAPNPTSDRSCHLGTCEVPVPVQCALSRRATAEPLSA